MRIERTALAVAAASVADEAALVAAAEAESALDVVWNHCDMSVATDDARMMR